MTDQPSAPSIEPLRRMYDGDQFDAATEEDAISQALAAYDLKCADLLNTQCELVQSKEHSEWLARDLCKMEEALGFKDDCHDKEGRWIPTIYPWLERLRDLIAAEGELGDTKQLAERLEVCLRDVIKESDRNTDSYIRARTVLSENKEEKSNE